MRFCSVGTSTEAGKIRRVILMGEIQIVTPDFVRWGHRPRRSVFHGAPTELFKNSKYRLSTNIQLRWSYKNLTPPTGCTGIIIVNYLTGSDSIN